MKKELHKTISYRILGSSLGCLVTWVYIGRFWTSVAITLTVVVTNSIAYLLHELYWRNK